MSAAIEAQELSKRYRIGQMQAAYGTLRDSLSRAAGRVLGRVDEHEEQEIWALRDVSFEVPDVDALLAALRRLSEGVLEHLDHR